MKTIHELTKEYGDACKRAGEEYSQWRAQQIAWARGQPLAGKTNASYKGFEIPYAQFESELGDIIQRDFNLTANQWGYIRGEAHSRWHAHYGDMFWGAYELAEWVSKYPKD